MKRKILSKTEESSFRDNDGFVFRTQDKLLRQVNKSYKSDYDLLLNSGLYQELTAAKLLIPHKEVSINLAINADAYKVIEPQKLDFISYPYEWCFSQLKEAALATLKIQTIALKFGMSLKDASSFNIQFVLGKPMLIDSLSFEKLVNKPWVAYRQFCQHFLNPLSLMSKIDPGLNRLLAMYLDGIPIKLTSKLLPLFSKIHPSLFIHVQLHSLMKQETKIDKSSAKPNTNSFSKNAMLGLVDSLEKAVKRLKLHQTNSFWSDYAPEYDSYTLSAFKDKEKIISNFFKQTRAKKVWDLGSNTGHFSRLVADLGGNVISFDYDPLSVEKNYLISKNHPNILPLILDLTNPTADLGWAGQERMSIIKRGPAECLLVLALIHHLAIAANIPLDFVAEYFSKLSRFVIIEFVPKEDPQVAKLLLLREDIFVNYEKAGFETAFLKFFKIIECVPIKGSLRTMYLMEKK